MITRICCAHAGGQGKTTVAQTLYVGSRKMGVETSLVSADFIDETGRSKLGRMYPNKVTELGTGPNVALAKQANDVNANMKYWDSLGPSLLKGNTIIDLGANVVDQILNWGKLRNVPSLLTARNAPPIDVFLVCKAEQRAVDDMTDLVRRFGEGDAFPTRKIYVVLNQQGGGFEGMGLREKLSQLRVKADLDFINLPRCTSELWVPMEQRYVSLDEAIDLEENAIQERLGVDFWSIFSGSADLNSWFSSAAAEFKRVGAL